MKNKRFISVDDSGESIFTFDEADMIIDTKTNIVYGANNIPDLVKILNSQSLQWQKLKEWLEYRTAENGVFDNYDSLAVEDNLILDKMQELEEKMLKIKEDKIKDLEKFKFYKEFEDDDFYVWHFLGDSYPDCEPVYECRVVIKNAEKYDLEERAIYIGDYSYGIPSVVYDLIKADMVEKVVEDE